MEGEVIAVGAGKREKGELIPLDVKPGDRVLFGKYSGTEIKIEDEELLILREEEILAKLSARQRQQESSDGLQTRSFLSGISHLHTDYQEEFRNGEADCYR